MLADWLHRVYVVPMLRGLCSQRSGLAGGRDAGTPEGHIFTRHTRELPRARQRAARRTDPPARDRAAGSADIGTARPELEALRAGGWPSPSRTLSSGRARHRGAARLDRRPPTARARVAAGSTAPRGPRSAGDPAHRADRRRVGRSREPRRRWRRQAGRPRTRIAELRAEVEQQRGQLDAGCGALSARRRRPRIAAEAVQAAREEAQQAAFHKQSCDNKIIEIDNSIKAISEKQERLDAALAARQQELAGYDEAPVQETPAAGPGRCGRAGAGARRRRAMRWRAWKAASRPPTKSAISTEQKLEPLREQIARDAAEGAGGTAQRGAVRATARRGRRARRRARGSSWRRACAPMRCRARSTG